MLRTGKQCLLFLGLMFTALVDSTTNDDDIIKTSLPMFNAGQCTIDRLPLVDPLPTPRQRPAVFFPTGATPALRNAAFSLAVSQEALTARLGHEVIMQSSLNPEVLRLQGLGSSK